MNLFGKEMELIYIYLKGNGIDVYLFENEVKWNIFMWSWNKSKWSDAY